MFGNLYSQDSTRVADKFPELTGPYLGQTPPGRIPQIFAPGIISTKENIEGSCTFSKEGNEFYFTKTEGHNPAGRTYIMVTKMTDSTWTEPVIAPFCGDETSFEPNIAPDGKKFYFNRFDMSDKDFKNGIWVMDRTDEGWSKPEFFIEGMLLTATLNGNIYYTDIANPDRDIVCAEFVNGKYDSAKVVVGLDSEYLDAHPCIAPDESFMIFDSRRPDNNAPWELYVSFRNDNGTWGKTYELSRNFNEGYKMTASISPDGKYLFYYSNGNIYWVDASVIKKVVPKEK